MVVPIAPAGVSVHVEKNTPSASSALYPNATYAVVTTRRTTNVWTLIVNPPTGRVTGCAPNAITPPTRAATATRIVDTQIRAPATKAFATSNRPRATGRMRT